jgi:D-glycero-D-manno-heptose 1,7-bisphosphate phosphatase
MRPYQAQPRAIFLDRDGTIIEDRHYVGSVDEVALLPGAREGMQLLISVGIKLFLFTNQSGVGRGYFTMEDVEAVNRRMLELLGAEGDVFAGVCIAPERPDEPQIYRKPSPRFIKEMLTLHQISTTAAWMIGDSPSDWGAGINAGIRVAAIVPDSVADRHRDQRLRQGIEGYTSLQEFAVQSIDRGSLGSRDNSIM